MGRKFSSIGRVATVLVLSGAIVAGTYAFTNANTVPAGKAGDGSGAVTGYQLSSVHYDLNDSNPGTIDAVEFTLDSVPATTSTIKAQLNAGTWYDCTNTGTSVTCDTTSPAATVLAATSLRVVVAD